LYICLCRFSTPLSRPVWRANSPSPATDKGFLTSGETVRYKTSSPFLHPSSSLPPTFTLTAEQDFVPLLIVADAAFCWWRHLSRLSFISTLPCPPSSSLCNYLFSTSNYNLANMGGPTRGSAKKASLRSGVPSSQTAAGPSSGTTVLDETMNVVNGGHYATPRGTQSSGRTDVSRLSQSLEPLSLGSRNGR